MVLPPQLLQQHCKANIVGLISDEEMDPEYEPSLFPKFLAYFYLLLSNMYLPLFHGVIIYSFIENVFLFAYSKLLRQRDPEQIPLGAPIKFKSFKHKITSFLRLNKVFFSGATTHTINFLICVIN